MAPQAKRQPYENTAYRGTDVSWVKIGAICFTILGTVGGSLGFISRQWERQFDFLKTNQQSLEARIDKRFEEVTQRFDKVDEKLNKTDEKFDKMDERLDIMDKKLDTLISKISR